ncbi:hypothetical protein RND71_007912 [Anisodus tanguticus]|uniref:RNase H type-1 domain-containing protein n=1 Tax=Anisodus tanguticus TaxID=243964 RepID=A0AAE1SN72_9SOLA|nr:hypothetical protein RND71_007912 [Anisodus tanguticus]
MAFSIAVQYNSNNMAEALAAEFGGKCTLQGYTNFSIELDSQVIANILKAKTTNNLKLKMIIDRTIEALEKSNVPFLHNYREGNQVADSLAKLAPNMNHNKIFYSVDQLPNVSKGPFQLDKWQMPSLRTRYDKYNFIVKCIDSFVRLEGLCPLGIPSFWGD